MHAPTDFYWDVIKRILSYLKGTVTHGLHITCSSYLTLHGFIDADWPGSVDDRKSTGGYLVIECTYIENIIGILLCSILDHYYCILPYTYIYRKDWLTNW